MNNVRIVGRNHGNRSYLKIDKFTVIHDVKCNTAMGDQLDGVNSEIWVSYLNGTDSVGWPQALT